MEHFIPHSFYVCQGDTRLGEIYALGLEIENRAGWETALADDVNKALANAAEANPPTKGGGSADASSANIKDKWDAHEKSIFDNLLVMTLDTIDRKSRRHQYRTAFKNAKKAEVVADPAAFAKWIAEKGGLIAAIKNDDDRPGPPEPVPFIDQFKKGLKPKEHEGSTLIDVDMGTAEGDLGLLLVQRAADGKCRIVRTANDPKVLMHFIVETDEALTRAQLARVEREAIFTLNRTVLKLAGLWRGKVEGSDIEQFQQAVKSLAKHQALAEKYFSGTPDLMADHENGALNISNPDLHALDPARYIGNAIPMKMVPYSLQPDTLKTKDTLEAIPTYRRWKGNPPRCRKQQAK